MTHALVATSKGSWIIDSGATCNDETLFNELRQLETPIDVTLGDGRCLKGIAEGTVTILPDGSSKKCKLDNVLLIPKLYRKPQRLGSTIIICLQRNHEIPCYMRSTAEIHRLLSGIYIQTVECTTWILARGLLAVCSILYTPIGVCIIATGWGLTTINPSPAWSTFLINSLALRAH